VTKIPRRAGVRPFCPSLHENSFKQVVITYEIRKGPVMLRLAVKGSQKKILNTGELNALTEHAS
jgi:hypothetical protein